MAVSFISEAGVERTANGGYTVAPENIVLKPELNGRFQETDVQELKEDILHRGQLIACICHKDAAGWPVLIAGHRRLRAISLINKDITDPDKKYRVKFNYAQVKSDEEALDLTVAENRNRTDVNPLDDAANIAIYELKFGKSLEEIARKYFPGAESPEKLLKAINWVKDRQKLLELSPEAQEELRKGFMSTSAALQLAEIPSKVVQNETIQKAKEKGEKKLKVEDAKAAKVEATGKPEKKHDIRDSAPVKLLAKFKKFAELAGALASECVAAEFDKDPDPDLIIEFSQQILVMCSKLGVPLEASSDSWARENQQLPTVIDNN